MQIIMNICNVEKMPLNSSKIWEAVALFEYFQLSADCGHRTTEAFVEAGGTEHWPVCKWKWSRTGLSEDWVCNSQQLPLECKRVSLKAVCRLDSYWVFFYVKQLINSLSLCEVIVYFFVINCCVMQIVTACVFRCKDLTDGFSLSIELLHLSIWLI